MTSDFEEALHAELSPSTSERWMNCTASPSMIRAVPKNARRPEGRAAALGTATHKLNELCLPTPRRGKPWVILPFDEADPKRQILYVGQDGTEYRRTPEMEEASRIFLDHVKSILLWNPSWVGVEARVEAVKGQVWGTADFAAVSRELVDVTDYKNGHKRVEVHGNSQAKLYGLGVVRKLKELELPVPKRTRLTIVQPNADHEDGPVRSAEFPTKALLQFEEKVLDVVERIDGGEKHFQVGEYCGFCDAQSFCRAWDEHVTKIAGEQFTAVKKIAEKGVDPANKKEMERLASIIKWESQLKDWLSNARAIATRLADAGNKVPGFKLVEKRDSDRYWSDEDKVAKHLLDGRLSEDQVYRKKLISPAQLEKLASKKVIGELSKYVVRDKATGGVLVPEDDPRSETKASVNKDFSPASKGSDDDDPMFR